MRKAAILIKLVGIDIDGTLIDSRGQLPEANRAAIAEASARGIHIAIATGRSFYFALPAVAPLLDPLTLIVHNGAITRTRSGTTLERRLLPHAHARAVLHVTRTWRDGAVLLFDRPHTAQMVYDTMDWTHPNRARFKERNDAIIEQAPSLEAALTEDPIQVAYNGTVDDMRALVDAIETLDERHDLSVSLTEYAHRDFSLVDICAAGTTKGTGLAALAERLGVTREETMAVGDNLNDREMLEWAGIGVVMGNAAPELLEAGFEVTGKHDEAGLAAALRRFALP